MECQGGMRENLYLSGTEGKTCCFYKIKFIIEYGGGGKDTQKIKMDRVFGIIEGVSLEFEKSRLSSALAVVKGNHLIPAAVFGLIQGLVRFFKKMVFLIVRPGDAGGNPHADGGPDLMVIIKQRHVLGLGADFLGKRDGVVPVKIGQKENKLFAAVTGDEIRVPLEYAGE